MAKPLEGLNQFAKDLSTRPRTLVIVDNLEQLASAAQSLVPAPPLLQLARHQPDRFGRAHLETPGSLAQRLYIFPGFLTQPDTDVEVLGFHIGDIQ